MSLIEEISIPVPWGHLSGKTYGDRNGRKVLVMHGWMDNSGTFDLLLPLLSEKFYFVCIDLPGHGSSSHLPPGFPYYALEGVTSVRRVIKYLKWKKFDYIGHSLGAAIGSVYASAFPDEIERMVMIDYAKMLTWANEREISDYGKLSSEFLAIDRQRVSTIPPTPYTLSKLCSLYVQVTGGGVNEEEARILLKRGGRRLKANADKWTLARDAGVRNGGMMRLSHDAMFQILRSIRCDLIILKATDGDWDEPMDVSEQALAIYKENCRSFQLINVPGNHFVPLTNPTSVAPHINEFLLHNRN